MKERSQTLIDPFMAPEFAPDSPYSPSDGTVAWRTATNGHIVLEVYQRANHTYGFRYTAWVAWRDAGGEARDHSWWQTEPEGLVTDEYDTACTVAERHAWSKGVELESPWRSVV